MDVKNKTVVITGGSSGIGKSIADQFAKKGAHVVILARRQDLLDNALEEIKKYKVDASQKFGAISLDVSSFEDVQAKFKQIAANYGDPYILINSAGIAYCNHFEKTSIDKFRQLMDIDYFGIVNTVHAVLPYMKKHKDGYIVNISSMAGFMGVFGYTGYSPAKFAVAGFSEVLYYELRKYNIKVSVLYPPDTDTPQLQEENKTKPDITRALAGNAKLMDPDKVAEVLIKTMDKGKFHIIPNFMGKMIYFINKWFPFVVRMVSFSTISKYEKPGSGLI